MYFQINQTMEENEAQSAYVKATKAECAKKFDLAYGLYLRSAEKYLHLIRFLPVLERDSTKWKAGAEKAIQRAEKIREFVAGLDYNRSASCDQTITPIEIDYFSKAEQSYVLKKGSSINGCVFPPWEDLPSRKYALPFCDPDGQPTLSKQQVKVCSVWRRPKLSRISQPIPPGKVVQRSVEDCSLCASIVVCLEHSRRFESKFLEAAVYSKLVFTSSFQDTWPNEGRYDIKLFINGTWRRIVVDDLLPYDPSSGVMMCLSVLSKENVSPPVWPTILEKGVRQLPPYV